MKKFLLVIALFFSYTLLMAQPPEGPADKGMTFGVATTEKDAIKAKDLSSILDSKEPREVKVQGKVVEVCKAEGCWLRMETADGASMMIRMKNHSFFVPVSMSGKTIVAEGTATLKETTVEMLRHYAEDAGKSKEEIATIKEPKKEIVLQATGILVL
ncbi:MAG TPA: DUF4920 domain-containing protein [Ferruginibacter sp.]|nr:DUF4920 domain-containing protein [Ferruginibacter sp.]